MKARIQVGLVWGTNMLSVYVNPTVRAANTTTPMSTHAMTGIEVHFWIRHEGECGERKKKKS